MATIVEAINQAVQFHQAGNLQTAEQIYKLAADIFGTMGQKSNYDANSMDKVLQDGAKNPAGFADTFTPQQKDTLHQLGQAIEHKQAIQ